MALEQRCINKKKCPHGTHGLKCKDFNEWDDCDLVTACKNASIEIRDILRTRFSKDWQIDRESYLWGVWIKAKRKGQSSRDYILTFRCDDYREIEEDNRNGNDVRGSRPGHGNVPHDFKNICKIQFCEELHKHKRSLTHIPKDNEGNFVYPCCETNKPSYKCKNRPGRVWPLNPGKRGKISRKCVNDILENFSDKIISDMWHEELFEKYNKFISYDDKYFEIGIDGKVLNKNLDYSDVSNVFYRWVMLVERIYLHHLHN